MGSGLWLLTLAQHRLAPTVIEDKMTIALGHTLLIVYTPEERRGGVCP